MLRRFLYSRAGKTSLLPAALLSVELLDEIVAGFPVIALPLIRTQFGLNYSQVALIFSVGALSAMLLDPIISIVSDRGSKRWWVVGGLLGLALSNFVSGNAPNFAWLLIAFACGTPAGSTAVGLAQASLIDLAPGESTRTMTRWTVLGSVGDLLSPIVVAALVGIGLGWPALCWLAGTIWLLAALLVASQHFPGARGETGSDEVVPYRDLLKGMREALRDTQLLRWGVVSLVTSMLDEVFVGFVALYLHDALHVNPALIALIMIVPMIGGLLSLLLLGRLLRRYPARGILFWLALIALVGVILLLSGHTLWQATGALFIISVGAAGWYPLAKGAMYARQPGRSGTVRAIASLGAPCEILLPAIVGLLAARFGLLAGLAFLGTAPLIVLLVTPWRGDR
ncbi:MAG: MFS transporter [Chloroflexota bacterium]|nr:MFS transporter [Chloroflexota bacterium]